MAFILEQLELDNLSEAPRCVHYWRLPPDHKSGWVECVRCHLVKHLQKGKMVCLCGQPSDVIASLYLGSSRWLHLGPCCYDPQTLARSSEAHRGRVSARPSREP